MGSHLSHIETFLTENKLREQLEPIFLVDFLKIKHFISEKV